MMENLYPFENEEFKKKEIKINIVCVIQSSYSKHLLRFKYKKTKLRYRMNSSENSLSELDFRSAPGHLNSLRKVKYIALLVCLLSISMFFVCGVQIKIISNPLSLYLAVGSIIFLITSIITLWWSLDTYRKYEKVTEIFQDQINENLTKVILVFGSLTFFVSLLLFWIFYFEGHLIYDYLRASYFKDEDWRQENGEVSEVFLSHSITMLNEYILLCLGITMLFSSYVGIVGLGLIKNKDIAFQQFGIIASSSLVCSGALLIIAQPSYIHWNKYPEINSIFSQQDLQGFLYCGLLVVGFGLLSLIFQIKNLRIGLFGLSSISILILFFCITSTGLGYRNSQRIESFYSGKESLITCYDRMKVIFEEDLIASGCKIKYIDETNCPSNQSVTPFEKKNYENYQKINKNKCLNLNCCNLLGDIYASSFYEISGIGLSCCLLSGILSIILYNQWYVCGVTNSQKPSINELIIIFIAVALGFIVIISLISLSPNFPNEATTEDGKYLPFDPFNKGLDMKKKTALVGIDDFLPGLDDILGDDDSDMEELEKELQENIKNHTRNI